MPEGDTIHGAAQRIRAALVGKEISAMCFIAGLDPWKPHWCPSCQA